MIDCNSTNMNLIVVQWIIIWILLTLLIAFIAMLDNGNDDPMQVPPPAKTNNQIDFPE